MRKTTHTELYISSPLTAAGLAESLPHPFHRRVSQLLARRQVDLLQFDADRNAVRLEDSRGGRRCGARFPDRRAPGARVDRRRTSLLRREPNNRRDGAFVAPAARWRCAHEAGGRRDVHQLRGRRARGVLPGTRLRRNEAPILRFRHTPVNPCRRKSGHGRASASPLPATVARFSIPGWTLRSTI